MRVRGRQCGVRRPQRSDRGALTEYRMLHEQEVETEGSKRCCRCMIYV